MVYNIKYKKNNKYYCYNDVYLVFLKNNQLLKIYLKKLV